MSGKDGKKEEEQTVVAKAEPKWLDTRLFRKKNKKAMEEGQSAAQKNAQSTIGRFTADQVFQRECLPFKPPTRTMVTAYSENMAVSMPKAGGSGVWLTVYGVVPGKIPAIVAYFNRFGTILRVDDQPGNWLYIEYTSRDAVDAAVKDCGRAPQIIGNGLAVCCSKGRRRSEYLPDKTKRLESAGVIEPEMNVVQPEEMTTVQRIYDAVFGD